GRDHGARPGRADGRGLTANARPVGSRSRPPCPGGGRGGGRVLRCPVAVPPRRVCRCARPRALHGSSGRNPPAWPPRGVELRARPPLTPVPGPTPCLCTSAQGRNRLDTGTVGAERLPALAPAQRGAAAGESDDP